MSQRFLRESLALSERGTSARPLSVGVVQDTVSVDRVLVSSISRNPDKTPSSFYGTVSDCRKGTRKRGTSVRIRHFPDVSIRTPKISSTETYSY